MRAVKLPLPTNGAFENEIKQLRKLTHAPFSIGYSGDWSAADGLLAGADAWFSVVAGLLPVRASELTRAAQAGDIEATRRLDAAFHPLWSLFREFGSFRVVFAMAECLGLFHAAPAGFAACGTGCRKGERCLNDPGGKGGG